MLKIFFTAIVSSLLCIISVSSLASENKISHDQKLVPVLQNILPLNINEIELLSDKEKLDLQCIAWNLYFEGRGSIETDKIAIAWVPINRTNHGHWSIDICENIFQYSYVNGKKAYQFIWAGYSFGSKFKIEHDAWINVQKIAYDVYKGFTPDPTNGATYFNHHSIGGRKDSVRIGSHVFYK